MIDTDRYHPELHAEAEANLIADAPLLLAEVLRLRERVATLESLMEYIADEEKVIE